MDSNNSNFLSHLISEDIYLIDEIEVGTLADKSVQIPIVEEVKVVEHEVTIVPEIKTEAKEAVKQDLKLEVAAPQPVSNPITAPIIEPVPIAKEPVPTPPIAQKSFKKVIILVGYKEAIPPTIQEALTKIFMALKLPSSDIEIINVLDSKAPNINDFTFAYLILMGGNGRNLQFLQDYTAERDKLTIARHKGAKLFFADNMDTYVKIGNEVLKRKFWDKLKELFEIK